MKSIIQFNISYEGGGLFGAALGYNWRFNAVIVGAEGDLSAASERGASNDIAPFNAAVATPT